MKRSHILAVFGLVALAVASCASDPDAHTPGVATSEARPNASPRRIPARYPTRAASAGHQAVCLAVFDVGEDGVPQNVCVSCSATGSHSAFERSVVVAMRQWRFTPITPGDETSAPREALTHDFHFFLDGRPTPDLSSEPELCRPAEPQS